MLLVAAEAWVWGADPSSSPPVSERTPTPDETSPTDPPPDPPNPPSYSAPIGGDQTDNAEALHDWLEDHEGEVVELDLDVEGVEVFNDWPGIEQGEVGLVTDCDEDQRISDVCAAPRQWELNIHPDPSGETGFSNPASTVDGRFLVESVGQLQEVPECVPDCPDGSLYRTVELVHQAD